jgi:hypothetical protein
MTRSFIVLALLTVFAAVDQATTHVTSDAAVQRDSDSNRPHLAKRARDAGSKLRTARGVLVP